MIWVGFMAIYARKPDEEVKDIDQDDLDLDYQSFLDDDEEEDFVAATEIEDELDE